MMMHTFTLDSWCNCLSMFGAVRGRGIFELCCFPVQTSFDLLGFRVLKLLVLYPSHLMTVLLWQNLAILYWLDSGVEVVLVDLAIYGSGDVLMADRMSLLMFDSWRLSFVNNGIVLAMSTNEFCDCCFGLFHVDRCVTFNLV